MVSNSSPLPPSISLDAPPSLPYPALRGCVKVVVEFMRRLQAAQNRFMDGRLAGSRLSKSSTSLRNDPRPFFNRGFIEWPSQGSFSPFLPSIRSIACMSCNCTAPQSFASAWKFGGWYHHKYGRKNVYTFTCTVSYLGYTLGSKNVRHVQLQSGHARVQSTLS
jgi:hypothetical protein